MAPGDAREPNPPEPEGACQGPQVGAVFTRVLPPSGPRADWWFKEHTS